MIRMFRWRAQRELKRGGVGEPRVEDRSVGAQLADSPKRLSAFGKPRHGAAHVIEFPSERGSRRFIAGGNHERHGAVGG